MGGMKDPPGSPSCAADKVTGASYKYSTNELKLPKSVGTMKYTSDLDGDGKQENQLQLLVQAVTTAKVDLQTQINESVKAGNAIILSEIQAPDLAESGCAGLTLALAEPPQAGDPGPKFDGSDVFKVVQGMTAKLFGKISAGKLNTTASKDQTAATEQRIELMLPLDSNSTLPLTVRGVHIEGTLAKDAQGQPIIKDGIIHGAVSKKDIDTKIVPAVATLITKLINNKPNDPMTATVIGLFEDTGKDVSMKKCMDASKCCHTSPTTCVILPEEVKASVVGGVLAPDVHVFDENDNWQPLPASKGGTVKNGMSVGIGFSSIKASY